MAGLVASVDKNASQYVATTSIQSPRVEIVENLTNMLMVSLVQVTMIITCLSQPNRLFYPCLDHTGISRGRGTSVGLST